MPNERPGQTPANAQPNSEFTINKEGPLAGLKAYISGGAGGIGSATSKTLVEQGLEEIVIGSTPAGKDRAQALADEFTTYGVKAYVSPLDIAAEDIGDQLGDVLRSHSIEHLDIVIHNAGTSLEMAGQVLSEEDKDLLWRTNYYSVVNTTKGLAKQGFFDSRTAIVVVSSVLGIHKDPNKKIQYEYSLTKAALMNLVTSPTVHSDLGLDPETRINVVAPGLVKAKTKNMASQVPAVILELADARTEGGLVTEDQVGKEIADAVDPNYALNQQIIYVDNNFGSGIVTAFLEGKEILDAEYDKKAKERKRLRPAAVEFIDTFKQHTAGKGFKVAERASGLIMVNQQLLIADKEGRRIIITETKDANPRLNSYSIRDTAKPYKLVVTRDAIEVETDAPDAVRDLVEDLISLNDYLKSTNFEKIHPYHQIFKSSNSIDFTCDVEEDGTTIYDFKKARLNP